MGRTGAKVRATKLRQNFSQQTQPIWPHWTLNSCFCAFRTIWVHLDCLVALKNSRQNGPNWCECSCHEVASEFFAMKALDPTHWTLNSRFGAFRTIWVHSGLFGCLTKLGAKRAELVQKFVSRSRIGIFRDECARSTPFDRKLTFWYVLYNLGAFRTIWLPYETLWKTGRTSATVRTIIP